MMGQRIPDWERDNGYDEATLSTGIEDIEQVNLWLVKVNEKMSALNGMLKKYERAKLKLEIEHKHKFNKIVYESTASTDSRKKLIAEIECEDLSTKIAYLDQIIKELVRESYHQKTQLDIIQTMGHNIRRQMTL